MLTITPEITALTVEAASRYNLPTALVLAIIQAESGGDPWAIRYEPAFFKRYIEGARIVVFGAVSHDTERMARATSWGLMQVMGQVARERGFQGAFLSSLCDPAMGIKWGCHHLDSLRIRFFDKYGWPGVVAAFNAGSPRKNKAGLYVNQVYVDKIGLFGGFA
ncbi:MAG: transglycosylase SLT domain-containing protein [Candidatus Competibacteraceae bacterium]|nr:transglycosylase SLT domain-containing protein [Candidatus Competibacteraceae bacterium]